MKKNKIDKLTEMKAGSGQNEDLNLGLRLDLNYSDVAGEGSKPGSVGGNGAETAKSISISINE